MVHSSISLKPKKASISLKSRKVSISLKSKKDSLNKNSKLSRKYSRSHDVSLSVRQINNGGFRPDAWSRGGNFRDSSGRRIRMMVSSQIKAKIITSLARESAEYNSGYHEAAVPTDLFIYLRSFYNSLIERVGTKDKLPETANLPSARPGSLMQRSYAGQKVYVHNVGIVGQLADAFRTDTAQTALSGPDGTATGHSGSSLNTKGQSSAHDLLRKAVLDIISINPKDEPGLTLESVSVLMGSIVVSSIAPGKLARHISGSLKAGEYFKENWEDIRNKSKERVHKCFNKLSKREQDFVAARSKIFLDSTNSSVGRTRYLGTDSVGRKRSTSTFRSILGGARGEIRGGDYEQNYTQTDYELPPDEVKEWGFYMTELFRGRQREAGGVQIDG